MCWHFLRNDKEIIRINMMKAIGLRVDNSIQDIPHETGSQPGSAKYLNIVIPPQDKKKSVIFMFMLCILINFYYYNNICTNK
jgi:hypothetical protein